MRRAVTRLLRDGQHVVVDATHVSRAARAEYIALARAEGVRTRCVHINNSLDFGRHMDHVRVAAAEDDARMLLPTVVYNRMRGTFEAPTLAEGFDVIHVVHNALILVNDKMRALYRLRYF